MQSTVTKRAGGIHDDTDERLDPGVRLQQKLISGDLLDDNDMERILSRPTLLRRKLDIFEAPEFVQRLSNYQEVAVGETVTFSGQYKAFPKPAVKWFKDEEEINETKRHNIDLSSEAEGIVRLIIQEVIRQDEGAYKCKVENQEGVASTTGYLSVTAKSPDKGHSGQTKKSAVDRVSTTPFLRPIVEQKSMEEREEKEYQRLPPSPLQEFIDNIRHGTKSMHGPIAYADLAEIYPDEYVIDYFDNETTGDEEEGDVFDDEISNRTPSVSPVNELSLDEAYQSLKARSTKITESQATHKSDSPFESTVASQINVVMTSQKSGEDSAYDSDGQDSHNPVLCSNKDTAPDSSNSDSSRRNRRLKLTLQRSQAVELSDADTSSYDTTPVVKLSTNGETGLDLEQKTPGSAPDQEIQFEMAAIVTRSHLDSSRSVPETGLRGRSAVDVIFSCIDSPWIQFFVGFVMSAVVLALAAEIPPPYLVAAVALLSFTSFVVLERHLSK